MTEVDSTPATSPGARPEGALDEQSSAAAVQAMFNTIAPRYDLLNHILSCNVDRYWWWRAARTFRHILARPQSRVLDICCGTGELTLELAKAACPAGRVIGLDFCPAMLAAAKEKIARSAYGARIELVAGNAAALPFDDNTFDAVTIGFALRNVDSISAVLAEMRRVAKPGGRVVSVELAKPGLPVLRQVYKIYFERLVPFFGRLATGKAGPYGWLPESLRRYPHQREVSKIFAAAGLASIRCFELTGGIVGVHVGVKP